MTAKATTPAPDFVRPIARRASAYQAAFDAGRKSGRAEGYNAGFKAGQRAERERLRPIRAPYGYRREGGELVPHEIEQAAAKRIAELRDGGLSWRLLTERVQREGLEGARGGKWTVARVRVAYDEARFPADLNGGRRRGLAERVAGPTYRARTAAAAGRAPYGSRWGEEGIEPHGAERAAAQRIVEMRRTRGDDGRIPTWADIVDQLNRHNVQGARGDGVWTINKARTAAKAAKRIKAEESKA